MIGNDEELLSHVRRSHERYLDELKALIAIPSVSANPQHRDDMQRCAMLLVERMREIGFESELLATEGAPFAYGRYGHDPAKPTVLIYGHYDVQPPEPFELWLSPPFEGTVRDGNIYGRGAVDDKGQVLMHLAALEAHLHVRGELPINVIVLVEGEEEIGSPNFESALVRYRDRFQADLAVISDTARSTPPIRPRSPPRFAASSTGTCASPARARICTPGTSAVSCVTRSKRWRC